MQVLVIGSSGATGRLVVDELLAADHGVRAMVRDPAQSSDLEAAGATPIEGDLEGDMNAAFDGIDAVMFCAGSGSKTGPDATLRVDLHGAVRSIDAAIVAGASRYVMLSSIGADDPTRGGGAPAHYLAAKHAADRILLQSGLAATVVRPGGLTHEPATGMVRFGVPRLEARGQVPRADVAAVLARCLGLPNTIGKTFEMISGDTPVEQALGAL